MTPIIRLDAGHDANGNPRRCYVVFTATMDIRAVYDEGYSGTYAVPKRLRRAASYARTFQTTPSEYRDLLRVYGS